MSETELHEKMAAFTEFIAMYGRSYAAKEEHESRFSIFSENLDSIRDHNARHSRDYDGYSYTMKVN